jgi:hypothetical protein
MGLEPTACCLQSNCSSQLSYAPRDGTMIAGSQRDPATRLSGSTWVGERSSQQAGCDLYVGSMTKPAAPTVWLIRTGEGGKRLTACLARGIVALRFVKVGDATNLDLDDIARQFGFDHKTGDPRITALSLWSFIHDVQLGDLVVTPRRSEREVWFGEVTGAYAFVGPANSADDLPHTRSVRWWSSLSRDDDFEKDRRLQFDRPPTLYRLPDQDWWLRRAESLRPEK